MPMNVHVLAVALAEECLNGICVVHHEAVDGRITSRGCGECPC